MVGRMDRQLRGFIALYLVVVAIFFVVAVVVAEILHGPLLPTLAEVYFFVGVAYFAATTLAWSGVANLYRYSPTLFVGSPSYRQQVVRGQMWKEGRDDRAFLIGLSFSGALLGLGAAIYDPVFLLVDVLGIAVVVVVLRRLHPHSGANS